MRLLYLPYEGTYGEQIAPRRALETLHRQGHLSAYSAYSFLYESLVRRSWGDMLQDLLRHATEFQPTAIFWEQTDAGPISVEFLSALKSLGSHPVIAQRTGDSYWKPPKSMVGIGRNIDITFLTGSTLIPAFERAGCHNVCLLPERLDTVRFGAATQTTSEPEFDVVMIAGFYRQLWFRQFPGQTERIKLARQFQKRFGKRFGLFGPGWQGYDSWQGPLPYDRQHDIMRRSRLILGNNNWRHAHYFSDRLLNALSSGIPTLYRRFPGCEEYFRHGEHLWYFDDLKDALGQADTILSMPENHRQSVGRNGSVLALENHSAEKRMAEAVKMMEHVIAKTALPLVS